MGYLVSLKPPHGPPVSGFFINGRYILTAGHCLPGLRSGDQVLAEHRKGAEFTARLCERVADVALLRTESFVAVQRPLVLCKASLYESWTSPNPLDTRDHSLSGKVIIRCERTLATGDRIGALQLLVDQTPPRDYGGRSGLPIVRAAQGGGIIGVLLEQVPSPNPDRTVREPIYTNTLYAAAIEWVVESLQCLRPPQLFGQLRSVQTLPDRPEPGPVPAPSPGSESPDRTVQEHVHAVSPMTAAAVARVWQRRMNGR